MATYSIEVAAQRAGVEPAEVSRLCDLGVLDGATGSFDDADVRRVQVVEALERAGLPIDDVARMIREGRFSLSFLDEAGAGVFAALSDTTFAVLSERTGIPLEVLAVLRDVTGGAAAGPDDRVREDELEVLSLLALQLQLGFRPHAVERALRVYGDSLRRIAEAEAECWRSEVQDPMLARGGEAEEVGRRAGEISPALSVASDRALLAIYHAQQIQVWSTNIVDGITTALAQAGLHEREERQPAMCFLDLSGFTQVTQEQGDAVAAGLVERLNRLVRRISVRHSGRPVKWFGDGVMLHFADPAAGVAAALEMVSAVDESGLPAAHVGLHAGPIVVQGGDFYGQTVNLASRIGEFARPGEVLVSRDVVEATDGTHVRFEEIGPVSLKGVSGLVEVYAAAAV